MDLETGKKPPAKRKKVKGRRVRKPARKTTMPKKKKLFLGIAAAAAVLLVLGAAGTGIFFVLHKDSGPDEPELDLTEILEEVTEEEPGTDMGKGVLSHIFKAGNAVFESYRERPKSYELTDENRADFAKISTCALDDSGRITITASGEGIPKSDDKFYYLFALNTYDTGIAEGADYIAREYKDSETLFTAGLNYNSSNSRLFKKFAVAVKVDGKYVKQAAYNIPVARLLGPTTSAAYPTIHYTYNGRTYTINGQVVAEYDLVFGTLTAKGITTTAIILNNYSPSFPQLIHPKARSGGSAPYYMFNGAEESGVEYMAAIGTFLAERYSGNSHGRISNWIIANEINARKEWNYMAHTDIETYVEEYARGFRVYISLDQQWDRNIKNNTNYDGRDIMDVFNRNISSKGNIDWGVAQHPYNVPLTEARIWKSSKYVKHSADTSMMTMDNIEVLIDYLKQDHFLTDDGQVRSILISELGYTSHAGEAYQAAAFAYAYYKIEAYDEIDGFLLNRQTDAAEEVAQGLAFGLSSAGGGRKQIYDVFKYIDTGQHAQYTDFAKDLIGISSWSEIMR